VRCDGLETTPKHLRDVQELRHFFEAADPGQASGRFPERAEIPLFILGSSVFGASVQPCSLAFAFASHFAPGALKAARPLPRSLQAFPQLERPYVMVAANVVVAERETKARRMFTSLQQIPCTLFAAVRSHYRNPWMISNLWRAQRRSKP